MMILFQKTRFKIINFILFNKLAEIKNLNCFKQIKI